MSRVMPEGAPGRELLAADFGEEELKASLASRVSALKSGEFGQPITPRLAILGERLHEHKPSLDYVTRKLEVAEELGMTTYFDNAPDRETLRERVVHLGSDNYSHGMMVQLPLRRPDFLYEPELSTQAILDLIPPKKDVDGLGVNAAYFGATPLAVFWWLKRLREDPECPVDYLTAKVRQFGLGRSLGAGLFKLLQKEGLADYEAYDINTDWMVRWREANEADINIFAAGRPEEVTPELWYADKFHVILDASASMKDPDDPGYVLANDDHKPYGDLSKETRRKLWWRGDWLTPRFGGVAPITILMVCENTITATENYARNLVTDQQLAKGRLIL